MEIWGIIKLRGHAPRAGQMEETQFAGAPFIRVTWVTGGEAGRVVMVPPTELASVEPLTEEQTRQIGQPGVSVQEVVQAIAELTGIPAARITSRCRVAEVALARFLVFRALRCLGMTLAAIGKAMGRDHGAVSSGLTTLHQAAQTSQILRDQIAWVKSRWATAVGAGGETPAETRRRGEGEQ